MNASPSSSLLRIGFLSPHNPFDRRAFPGTAFHAADALRKQPRVRITVLGGHRPPGLCDRLFRRASPKLDRIALGELDGLDAVLGLVASQLLDRIERPAPVPLIHVSDATPAFLRDCYGWNISADIEAREARVITKSDAVVYSSVEIARRAKREFGVPASAVPFGTNLEAGALPAHRPEKPPLGRLQLLFIGNDWVRKGGEIAVAALDSLRAQGIEAHLTIVGRLPEIHKTHPHVTHVGFLNKNKPADAAGLARLYAEAHLLLLPSRADCTPMVAAEAMAHGTPVIASNTGGIASLVGGAGTGRILPLAATGAEWAGEIQALAGDPFAYHALSDAAFDRARARLNCSAWAADMVRIVDALREDAVPVIAA